jgi:hypothetical protein
VLLSELRKKNLRLGKFFLKINFNFDINEMPIEASRLKSEMVRGPKFITLYVVLKAKWLLNFGYSKCMPKNGVLWMPTFNSRIPTRNDFFVGVN